jgi:hypothetical protein
MFLLDTVVPSELRKPLRQRNPNLVYWIEAVSSRDLFISVVTIESSVESSDSKD